MGIGTKTPYRKARMPRPAGNDCNSLLETLKRLLGHSYVLKCLGVEVTKCLGSEVLTFLSDKGLKCFCFLRSNETRRQGV
jgi:hypothetical protein